MYEATMQTPNPEQQGGEVTARIDDASPFPGMKREEFLKLVSEIMILIPHRSNEGIAPGICRHFGIWGRFGLKMATIKDPNGGFLEILRGSMLNLFLEQCDNEPRLKYAIMIDNDQAIEWWHPIQLAKWGEPVVSGVVCGYNHERGVFACFTAKDEDGAARFPTVQETKKLPATGLIRAEQVGTGLMCLRKDVAQAVSRQFEAPFMLPEKIRVKACATGTLPKGEDIVFCERVKELGYDIFVDMSVHAKHLKSLHLSWPSECIDPTIDPQSWKPSKYDKGV